MALLNARFSGVRDLRKWAARMQVCLLVDHLASSKAAVLSEPGLL